MRGNVIETVMGAVVLAVAALFLFFAYSTSRVGAAGGYDVIARFSSIDGIRDGSDVRIAGVKVGSVSSVTLNPKSYLATVRMNLNPAYKLPLDTSAQVASSGLLGDKYISLVPGGSEKTIPPGGRIKYTQSAVNLENLIGQMIFSPQTKGKETGGAGGLSPLPAPGAAPKPMTGLAPGAAPGLPPVRR